MKNFSLFIREMLTRVGMGNGVGVGVGVGVGGRG